MATATPDALPSCRLPTRFSYPRCKAPENSTRVWSYHPIRRVGRRPTSQRAAASLRGLSLTNCKGDAPSRFNACGKSAGLLPRPALRDQHVQDVAMLVFRSAAIAPLTTNGDEDLDETPNVALTAATVRLQHAPHPPAEASGKRLPARRRVTPNCSPGRPQCQQTTPCPLLGFCVLLQPICRAYAHRRPVRSGPSQGCRVRVRPWASRSQ